MQALPDERRLGDFRRFIPRIGLSNRKSAQQAVRQCCQCRATPVESSSQARCGSRRHTAAPRPRCPQPARGRRPHRTLRAPIVFCLIAADREHGAVERELAGRRDLVAVVDVVAELLHHLEREGEPGRRAADVARVDLHVERQLDLFASWSTSTPMIGALRRRPGRRDRRHAARPCRSCRRGGRDAHVSPGFRLRDQRAEIRARRTGFRRRPATTITSSGSSFPPAGRRRRRDDDPSAVPVGARPCSRAARSATAAAISCDSDMSCSSILRCGASLDPGRARAALDAGRASRRRAAAGTAARAATPSRTRRRRSRSRRRPCRASRPRPRRAARPGAPRRAGRGTRPTGASQRTTRRRAAPRADADQPDGARRSCASRKAPEQAARQAAVDGIDAPVT